MVIRLMVLNKLQITQKEALFLAQAMKEPTLLYDMITQNIFKILLKYQK